LDFFDKTKKAQNIKEKIILLKQHIYIHYAYQQGRVPIEKGSIAA